VRNLAPGSKLGRFQILSVVGEGAMGVVYLARDPEIERSVAVKTLRAIAEASGAARADLEARFLKEAKLAGRLQHPNVVTVYEVGREGETSFIAMEYVDGESLNRVASSDLDLDAAARIEIVRQIAQALEHAHGRGVLHRDIKPGNILVTRDRRVKVADFGIGKLLASGTGDLTRTGQMLGSPAYMSPEQIKGEKLDGRSDLFSLGVVTYELLTGARPFPGDSITTLVYQILHTEPRDPLALRGDLPPVAREVFARLLAKSPDRRPADAAGFLKEIRRIEAELRDVAPTQALSAERLTAPLEVTVRRDPPAPPAPVPPPAAPPPPPVPAPPAPPKDRWRSSGPLYLFGAAALLGAIAFLLWIWRSPGRREELAAAAPGATPAPAARVAPEATASIAPTEAPTLALPTPGPAEAADAIVGATRIVETAPAPTRARPTPRPAVPTAVLPPPPTAVPAAANTSAAPPGERGPADDAAADKVYRTRRFAKFSSSPDQARLYLDGHYTGIVDDWDDRGGGKTLPLATEGRHRVRLELPGYRTIHLDVLVTPEADDETVEIDDELKRLTKVDYPKLKGPAGRTDGPVIFSVVPPGAIVSENGRALGPASAFGPASPLKLTGPMVHDLEIAAPGFESRVVRILVSSNADRPQAVVTVALKPLPDAAK
jgi:serine/threonine-protein kinase